MPELRAQVLECGGGQLPLVDEMFGEELDEFDLLFGCKASDGGFEDRSGRGLVDGDEALVVHEGEESHDELAVHAVSHAAVAGNRITKVLDVESALETRCKEATEGSDERRKGGHHKDVELHRRDADGGRQVRPIRRDEGQLVSVRDEDRVRVTFKTSEDVGSEVVDGADEVLGAHEHIGHGEAKQNGKDPCTDEACNC